MGKNIVLVNYEVNRRRFKMSESKGVPYWSLCFPNLKETLTRTTEGLDASTGPNLLNQGIDYLRSP